MQMGISKAQQTTEQETNTAIKVTLDNQHLTDVTIYLQDSRLICKCVCHMKESDLFWYSKHARTRSKNDVKDLLHRKHRKWCYKSIFPSRNFDIQSKNLLQTISACNLLTFIFKKTFSPATVHVCFVNFKKITSNKIEFINLYTCKCKLR